jgi:hypothetical protein
MELACVLDLGMVLTVQAIVLGMVRASIAPVSVILAIMKPIAPV